jgi:hypothetical protein
MVYSKSPTIKLNEKTKNKLDELKVHKNQSYSEVVGGLLVINQHKPLSQFWEQVKLEAKKIKNKKEENKTQ